jgi:DNA-binding NarL/FixJ family response regulator
MHLKPNLVVLDHLFPEDTGQLSGLDVIKKMRMADKDVSIIVLSSQQDDELIPEFLKVGAKQYISKDDYFIDALIETIEAEVGS